MTSEYFLDNAWDQARRRLELLHEVHDPATIRRLEATGVGPGWNVLVPGGGGGSIVRWLAERVGPDGHVLSTDIDTRFLAEIEAPNVEVIRHDIAVDELPEAGLRPGRRAAAAHPRASPGRRRAEAGPRPSSRAAGWSPRSTTCSPPRPARTAPGRP